MVEEKFSYNDHLALHKAIGRGDIAAVRAMLANGLSPEVPVNFVSPLFVAGVEGTPEIIDILVAAGANPNRRMKGQGQGDNALRTALNGAAMYGDLDCVERLLDHGADPRIRDDQNRTAGHLLFFGVDIDPMTKAEFEQFTAQLTRMLDAGLDVNQRDKEWRTLLHHAVIMKAPPKIIDLLMSRGADPHMRDKEGYSACHWALMGDRKPQAEALARHGVDLDFVPAGYPDPLHRGEKPLPAKRRSYSTRPKKGAVFTPGQYGEFFSAIRTGDVESVRQMLAAGMPVEITISSQTPLFVAAGLSGSVEILDLLLAAGADPNRQMTSGSKNVSTLRTAINYAARETNLTAVERLLDYGADPRVLDDEQHTAAHLLMLGLRNNTSDLVESDRICAILDRMIECGLRVNQQDESKRTVLFRALLANAPRQVIDKLLDSGADPLCPSVTGRSPFHLASAPNRIDYLDELLRRGASIDFPTLDGETLLHLAEDETALQAILQRAPNIDARDHLGRTPLAAALHRWDKSPWQGRALMLIAAGADVDVGDLNGVTPRDIIMEKNIAEVAALIAAREARATMGRTIGRVRSPAP